MSRPTFSSGVPSARLGLNFQPSHAIFSNPSQQLRDGSQNAEKRDGLAFAMTTAVNGEKLILKSIPLSIDKLSEP